jgi:FixJ family two-component response regulator
MHAPAGTVTERIANDLPAGTPPRGDSVWIVEDEPTAAELAAELCAGIDVPATVFDSPQPFLAALRDGGEPRAVVLDWRLEHELSAALFLAIRHRFPVLPVIYWTGSPLVALPSMIRDDPLTRFVDKAGGSAAFERALRWALDSHGGMVS